MAKTKKENAAELSAALLAVMNAPVPVHPTCKISKSKYMAGVQCPKREYLEVHQPELAEDVDDGRMEQGMDVGSVARRMGLTLFLTPGRRFDSFNANTVNGPMQSI